ncbi:unnamed protein product [Rotaria magnacalcarata]|uniref:Uncharacterized protein n=2 Tax=Rotaria magnacalcarata TaxID=392030 RepID=A0A815FY26_9BILA|nr:unnamed protein product [Rotaria magnacalcarata]
MIDKWTGTKYDCIYSYMGPDFFDNITEVSTKLHRQPKEQISPYCIAFKYSSYNDELCIANGGVSWSFEQLKKLNITGNDLVNWNAPVNTIDEYEYYLEIGYDESSTFYFCNCTNNFVFGIHCQYRFDLRNASFDSILKSHFRNRVTIAFDEAIQRTNSDITCYKRDVSCFGSCLDWRQICNTIADCQNGYDERSCELLEFNECDEDQYRCRSGHCIPLAFAFDTNFDCADASDETNISIIEFLFRNCYRQIPNMYCDDLNDA